MPLLRLRQFAEGENCYLVHLELESEGARRSAESRFEFKVSAQDQEDMRWYLEDYLQYPLDPARDEAHNIECALHHYRESIRYDESAGDLYGAAGTQYNVAIALMGSKRFADAREYAAAALRNYQTYGASAAKDVQDTLDLIARIAKAASA
jgi:tetratricopeptide (TPR) repeat protein